MRKLKESDLEIIRKGTFDEIKELLKQIQNINEVDERYQTTILLAALGRGDAFIVEYILQCGADPNIPTSDPYKIPFYVALYNKELLQLLLRYGCTIAPTYINSILLKQRLYVDHVFVQKQDIENHICDVITEVTLNYGLAQKVRFFESWYGKKIPRAEIANYNMQFILEHKNQIPEALCYETLKRLIAGDTDDVFPLTFNESNLSESFQIIASILIEDQKRKEESNV